MIESYYALLISLNDIIRLPILIVTLMSILFILGDDNISYLIIDTIDSGVMGIFVLILGYLYINHIWIVIVLMIILHVTFLFNIICKGVKFLCVPMK